MFLERKPGKGFNALSVLVGLGLLAFWIYFAAIFTTTNQVRNSHGILMTGFGAILTLFIVKFACSQPAGALAGALGLTAGMVAYALVGPAQYTMTKLLLVAVPGAMVGVPLFFLFRPVLPRRLALRGEELAVIYTIVVIGAATAIISRSTFMAAEGLWRDEYQLQKWLPPHFLPDANAVGNVANAAYVKGPKGTPPADPNAPQGEPAPAEKQAFTDKSAKRGLLEGHANVPWFSWFVSGYGHGLAVARWTFPALFWTILLLTVEFFFLFVVLVFRKRWIEEERFPFPLAQLPLSIIGEGEADGAKSAFDKRVSWIAFGVGFALCLAAVLSVSRTNTKAIAPLDHLFLNAIPTRVDLTGYKLVPVNMSIVWLSPLVLLIMLFMPLDVLLTMALTYFLVAVGLEILFKELGRMMGIQPEWEHVARGIAFGGAVGLTFWTLVFQWKEIERLFVGFLRRTRSSMERKVLNLRNFFLLFWAVAMVWAVWVYPTIYGESLTSLTRWLLLGGTVLMFLYVALSSRRERIDPDDSGPMGARSLLLVLSAAGLAFVALTLPGRSVGLLVGSTALIFVYSFASIRARAESPQHEMYEYDQGRIDATIQARYTPGPADASLGLKADANHWWNTPPGVLSHFYGWELGAYYRRWGPHNSMLDTFKIGHETGASASDVLKALVLAMVVAAVCTPFLSLYFTYTYGLGGVNYPLYFYEDYISGTGHMYIFGVSSMEPPKHFDVSKMYTWPVAGFLVMGIIIYMRREYVWFPFHPIGFLMGAWIYQVTGYLTDIWFTVIIAFFVKRTIYKWFGVRYFREKVQPVLVFAAMGMVIAIVIFVLRFAVELSIGVFKWS